MAKQVKVGSREFAEKWNRRIKGATQDVRAGVERVTESPMEAAIAALPKMQQRFNEAVASGKVERGLRRRTLQEWKDRVVNVGIPRIAAGADAAVEDVQDFAEQLIEHENRGLAEIERLPNVTLDDSINRMTAWVRHMAEFRRQ